MFGKFFVQVMSVQSKERSERRRSEMFHPEILCVHSAHDPFQLIVRLTGSLVLGLYLLNWRKYVSVYS